MNTVYLCLGGNLGDREKYLRLAGIQLEQQLGPIQSSSRIYETAPWGEGTAHQNAYLNQVICLHTTLPPLEVLTIILSIEQSLGRHRQENERYAARTIDIDILFYNQDCIETKELTVPHPRLHQRAFVLNPLCEIAPEWKHPVLQESMKTLAEKLQETCAL